MTDDRWEREGSGNLAATAIGVTAVTGVLLLLPGICAVFFTHAVISALFSQRVRFFVRFLSGPRSFTIEDIMRDQVWGWGIISAGAGVVLVTLAIWVAIRRHRRMRDDGQVTRAIGVLTLLIGLLPLIAFGSTLGGWAQHMYTLGISFKAGLILVLTAFADVLLISGGLYLLSRPKQSN